MGLFEDRLCRMFLFYFAILVGLCHAEKYSFSFKKTVGGEAYEFQIPKGSLKRFLEGEEVEMVGKHNMPQPGLTINMPHEIKYQYSARDNNHIKLHRDHTHFKFQPFTDTFDIFVVTKINSNMADQSYTFTALNGRKISIAGLSLYSSADVRVEAVKCDDLKDGRYLILQGNDILMELVKQGASCIAYQGLDVLIPWKQVPFFTLTEQAVTFGTDSWPLNPKLAVESFQSMICGDSTDPIMLNPTANLSSFYFKSRFGHIFVLEQAEGNVALSHFKSLEPKDVKYAGPSDLPELENFSYDKDTKHLTLRYKSCDMKLWFYKEPFLDSDEYYWKEHLLLVLNAKDFGLDRHFVNAKYNGLIFRFDANHISLQRINPIVKGEKTVGSSQIQPIVKGEKTVGSSQIQPIVKGEKTIGPSPIQPVSKDAKTIGSSQFQPIVKDGKTIGSSVGNVNVRTTSPRSDAMPFYLTYKTELLYGCAVLSFFAICSWTMKALKLRRVRRRRSPRRHV